MFVYNKVLFSANLQIQKAFKIARSKANAGKKSRSLPAVWKSFAVPEHYTNTFSSTIITNLHFTHVAVTTAFELPEQR